MEVKVKKSSDGMWGFVESFQVYRYHGKGSINVLTCITPDGEIAEPYIYKGGEFVPARVVDGQIGIERYVWAKKPFYCKLSDGFIAYVKAGIDFDTGEFLEGKSSFSVYTMGEKMDMSYDKGVVQLHEIFEVTDRVRDMMSSIMKAVCATGEDRVKFLKSRFKSEEVSYGSQEENTSPTDEGSEAE